MAAEPVLLFHIVLRWWVMPYVNTLKWFALTFNQSINSDRVVRFVMQYGIKIVLEGKKPTHGGRPCGPTPGSRDN